MVVMQRKYTVKKKKMRFFWNTSKNYQIYDERLKINDLEGCLFLLICWTSDAGTLD